MEKDQLLSLFPTPVAICACPFDYSKELEWINTLKCKRKDEANYNRQSEDTFVLDHIELKRVKSFIETKLKNFMNLVYGSERELVITQSWINKNGKGESHHTHTHPNSMVSGVWYPVMDDNLPPLQFRNNRQRDIEIKPDKINKFNSAMFLLPLDAGELILFPSNIPHAVPENPYDKERISLSFNTWTKGNIGSIEHLTYLPFDRLLIDNH